MRNPPAPQDVQRYAGFLPSRSSAAWRNMRAISWELAPASLQSRIMRANLRNISPWAAEGCRPDLACSFAPMWTMLSSLNSLSLFSGLTEQIAQLRRLILWVAFST
jgi:hypothetical protein